MARNTGDREPAINLPGLVALTIAALIAIHAVREFLPDETDIRLLFDLAFVPGPFSVAFGSFGIGDLIARATDGVSDRATIAATADLARFLTEEPGRPYPWTPLSYALLHGSWLHLGLNCVWLAAFGSPVVRRIGNGRAIVLALATTLGGAAAHWLAHPAGLQPVIGASAAVSGFMAAAATFVFNRGREGLFDQPERRTRASLAATFANRDAVAFLVVWFVVNIAFGLAAGPLGIVGGGIAWEAHIGGLLVGLALFPVFDRGSRVGAA